MATLSAMILEGGSGESHVDFSHGSWPTDGFVRGGWR